ncbi:MAG TPA: hypothetical protein VE978_03180 [Chitinophagales bacterium]|nr:hypothetical protein [Chitinophagales bacterium]
MTNTTRFLLFFVAVIALDVIFFYAGISIFFNEPLFGWLEKLADDSTEQAFYAIAFPIAGIVIFNIAALVLFSKYGLKEK